MTKTKKKQSVTRAAERLVRHVTALRDANLFNGLNHQVQWAVRDHAAEGAKWRRSQAAVEGLYLTDAGTLYVHYADHASVMFRDVMGDLTPRVANGNFIGYTVPDGSGPRDIWKA